MDRKGASLDTKKVRNWAMKKTQKKSARLGKKGAKMDKGRFAILKLTLVRTNFVAMSESLDDCNNLKASTISDKVHPLNFFPV